MKRFIYCLVAVTFVFGACDNKEPENFIVDNGAYAFKQSEQRIEVTSDTESVRLELYYTEQPDEAQYGWVTLQYNAQKSTPNIENYIAIPTYQKWNVADDGTLYYDMHINTQEIKSEICVYLYVMFGNEVDSEHHREMLLQICPQWYNETTTIADLVNDCKDFDAETLLAGIEGKWMPDSLLIYDDEWVNITTPLLVMGEDYVDGRASSFYIFAADGTGSRYVHYPEPDMEPETLEFNWTYDTESRKLKFTGDYKDEWSVTGYSNDYIVLDQISREGWNYRTILKRQAEGDVPTVISYMEYTLSGTQCEWQLPLLNNNVIIVDSDEDLTKYITSENGDSYPHVDFTKYTMIIANGGTPQGISDVIIDSFQQITEAEYNLNIRVLMTMTDAPELWVKALLVDKWDRPSTVNLNVEIIGQ